MSVETKVEIGDLCDAIVRAQYDGRTPATLTASELATLRHAMRLVGIGLSALVTIAQTMERDSTKRPAEDPMDGMPNV